MNSEQSGGKEQEMKNQLRGIDKWLSQIVKGRSPILPKDKPLVFNKPQSPQNVQPSSPSNPKPYKHLKKMNFKKFTRDSHHTKQPKPFQRGELRIIPLGGFEEVGKNTMVFEAPNDIIVVDMGFQFPEEDMLGIDYVLPDITYLIKNKHKLRGIFLTHGHLDHIGGVAYLLPQLGYPPVYGAPLTIGFVKKQLEEFKILKHAKLVTFDPKEHFKLGAFDVSFFRVNHSIPDAVAIVIDTPSGRIVHTGDFKFDFTPADDRPADFQEIAAVGRKGISVLISDSTNSLEMGHTTSEKVIAENLAKIIRHATGRLIITSFSSLIGRLQQIMDTADKCHRKIFLTGRSMAENIKIAQHLGYIKVPRGLIVDIRNLKKYRDEHVLVLTTGSQGEDLSALARMAMDTHAQVRINEGDTVVLSSSPIIGNETAIVKVINGLCRRGAKVITSHEMDVHTSGHGKQEDLKLMIKLINPKYMIPAHGNLYMRMAHRELATLCGIPEKHVFLLDNGNVVEGDPNAVFRKTEESVPAEYVMVEGPDKAHVGLHILSDRQLMAENGALIVLFRVNKGDWILSKPPHVATRGFVFLDASNEILKKVIESAESSFKTFVGTHKNNVSEKDLKSYLQQTVDRTLVRLLDKRPLVIPVIVYN